MAFEVEFDAMLVGSEESGSGSDTFRSILISSGTETLKLYANRDSEDAFNAVKTLPPGSNVRVRAAIQPRDVGGLKLRLLDVHHVLPKGSTLPASAAKV